MTETPGSPQAPLMDLALALGRETAPPTKTGPLCSLHPDYREPCSMCERAGIGRCPRCGAKSKAPDAYCSGCAATVTANAQPAGRETAPPTPSSLLDEWREQDRILQEIAAICGDEHITCAADVLAAVQALAACHLKPKSSASSSIPEK